MQNIKVLLELKEEFHRMNLNIERLLERDKVQNKRIDKNGEDIESLRNKVEESKDFNNKVFGAISFVAFLMPLILKFIK